MMKTMRERLSLKDDSDGVWPYHELESLLDRAVLATLMMREHMRLTAHAYAEIPSAEHRKIKEPLNKSLQHLMERHLTGASARHHRHICT